MAELIYSIGDVFDDKSSYSCLSENDTKFYYIPAYQRGYKWESDEYGAVTVLLNDLSNAFNQFEKGEAKEYYLQYITLKKDSDFLEVIDGQQRLTTLSILLSVLALKLGQENIASGKLNYAIRTNFFNDCIYNKSSLIELLSSSWDKSTGLIINNTVYYNQDTYYIFHAAKKVNDVLGELKNLKGFYDFLLKHVKIILNVVSHASSEKVFSNLNSNKVALTEVELIKALFITKLGRITNSDTKRNTQLAAIEEKRKSLGRQWDTFSRWLNQADVKTFLFNKKEGMHELLELVALHFKYTINTNAQSKDFPLFNFFHQYGNIENIYEIFRKYYHILNDWFYDDELYNKLGYLLHAKKSDKKLASFLSISDFEKSDFKKELNAQILNLLPESGSELFYENDQDIEIHRALLFLNVFPDGRLIRFGFHHFIEEKWTLEHIFPQNITGKNQELTSAQLNLIKEMVDEQTLNDVKKIQSELKEQDQLIEALKTTQFLNGIGNMCLLTNKDNSSNGCLFFDDKRTNILNRIRKGSFVPKHTFDIFSKMIFDNNPGDLTMWTKENILQHKEIIVAKLGGEKYF